MYNYKKIHITVVNIYTACSRTRPKSIYIFLVINRMLLHRTYVAYCARLKAVFTAPCHFFSVHHYKFNRGIHEHKDTDHKGKLAKWYNEVHARERNVLLYTCRLRSPMVSAGFNVRMFCFEGGARNGRGKA